MKFSIKTIAKWLIVVAIGLMLILVLQQPSRCEGFQEEAAAAAKGRRGTRGTEGPVEIPIPPKDLEAQTFTLPMPEGMDDKKLTSVYFKLWNPSTKKWGPILDSSKLPRTFDEGDSTLIITNGKTRLRKKDARGKLGSHKEMPVPVKELKKDVGLTIKGLNNANFGTLPATGDSNGSKVAVGLVFQDI